MDNLVEAELSSEVTNWKAWGLGLGLTVIGVLGAGLSTIIKAAWLQNTALALATTLVSTGALALLFEIALRRSVYREMLRLVGVNRSVASQHLASAGKIETLDWAHVFQSKSKMSFLLTDPSSWIDQNIVRLLENARTRPVHFRFFLPDPNAAYSLDIADSLTADHTAFKHSILSAANRVERTWNDLKGRPALAPKSEVEIRFLDRRPLFSLAACDDVTVIVLTSVTGRIGADADYYYRHVGDRGQFPSSWFLDQLDRLEQLPIRFIDRIN